MRTHTVIDGNAFYEVDDECMERLRMEKKKETGDGDVRGTRRDRCRILPEKQERKGLS